MFKIRCAQKRSSLAVVALIVIVFLFVSPSATSLSNAATIGRAVATWANPSTIGPKNSSELIDESFAAPYDSLDPGVGFFTQDGYFVNVFQSLVQYNGSDSREVVPSLASSWSISKNYENYTFTMRSKTWFSNNDSINAYDAWFSFVRILYINNPSYVGVANYAQLTINMSNPRDNSPCRNCGGATGSNLFPDGLQAALVKAGVPNNENALVSALNQMLSNFNPSNATQVKIMSYPHQAYVASSSSKFVINLIQPYELFLLVLPPQWGAIVDPKFIDAHGGVQNNTSPAYFSEYGMPGSGPYMYQANPPQNRSSLTLLANPNYWAKGVSGLAPVLQPAHIKTVIMRFGLAPNSQISDFDSNNVQLISPPVSDLGQAYSGYQWRDNYTFNQLFFNASYPLGDIALMMNTQVFPTNITLLRQAIVHAVNYTDFLSQLYTFNGTSLGELFLPPIPPGWGPLDNPKDIPLYSYNITLAQQLISEAGKQNGFYVLLPNGTKLGDTNGVELPPIEYAYVVPAPPSQYAIISILQNDLIQIGINIAATGLTGQQLGQETSSPSTTPPIVAGGWIADWADPIFQLFYPLGTESAGQPNWVNNGTLNALLPKISFETNATLQEQQTIEAYNVFTQLATMIQLPWSMTYYLHQPYMQGLTYSLFQFGFYYNLITYTRSSHASGADQISYPFLFSSPLTSNSIYCVQSSRSEEPCMMSSLG